jgi:hypothetical protein
MVMTQDEPAVNTNDPLTVQGAVAACSVKSPEFAPPKANPLTVALAAVLLLKVTFSSNEAPRPWS